MTVLLRRLAALAAPLAVAAAAAAQPGPTPGPATTLADGRSAITYTFGDGQGYSLSVEGESWPATSEGRPEALLTGDVDGDGVEDVIVLLADPTPDGLTGAHVWDLSIEGPYLIHSSAGVGGPDDALDSLRREVRDRFALANGLAAIGYLREALDLPDEADWETRNLAFPNHLNTLEGVIVHAEVREARVALTAAEGDEAVADAARALEDAMERREAFARDRSETVYD